MKTKHKTKHKSIEKAVPKFRERLFLMRDNPRCNHVTFMAVGVDPVYIVAAAFWQ